MNEQVKIPGTGVTVANRAALAAGGAVVAFVPQTLDEVWRFAQVVTAGGFAPPGLKSPEAVMVAVMHGAEIGLTPFASIKNIAVINNRPSLWGDALAGVVRASGKCEYIKETVSGPEGDWVASCTVKRKGEPEETRTFSTSDAKRAGVWSKAGPWTQYPKRMLAVRARSFALRDVFADVLGGLDIREEVEDSADDLIDVTPPPATPPPADEPTPAIARRRGPRAAKAAQPEAEEESPPPAEVVTVDGEVIEASPPAIEEAEFAEAEPETVDPDELLSALRLAFASAESKDAVGEAWDTHAREIAGQPPELKARASGLYKARLEELSGETEEQRKERLRPAYDAGVLAFFRGRKASLGVEKPWRDDEELSKTYMKGYRKAEKGEVANPDIPPPADDFPGDSPPPARLPPSEADLETAYQLGQAARAKGMSPRALPGEYRSDDRAAEAAAWREGWNDAAAAAP